MGDHDKRAEALIMDANKKMKPSGVFSMFSSPRFDEAAELLAKAANSYKIAKKCESVLPILLRGLVLMIIFNRGQGRGNLL